MLAFAVSAGALAVPGLAQAQEPSPNVPVTERARPELDPLGIRAGGFLVFPSITVAETYDDNVFATPDDEESDFITLLQPRVRVVSDFPRHALGLTAGGDIAFYASESDENFQDFFLSGDGRLDVTRETAVRASTTIGRFHQGRDDPEDIGADEISTFYRYGGEVSFEQLFNRLNYRLTGRIDRVDFEDSIDRDLDRTEYDALARVGFFVSPRFNTFVEGRYNLEDRDVEPGDLVAGTPVLFDRDSHGWETRVGTAVDITAVLFGEAFVGYRQQYFDDDAFDDEDGISFGANLTWNPTLLTTLRLTGGADFVPTRVDDASSNFRSAIALRVDHELLRNLLIGGTVGYVRDDFSEIDRVDDTINAGANITYILNRNFAVEGAYLFTDRSSDLDTEEFTRNRITLSLTARL